MQNLIWLLGSKQGGFKPKQFEFRKIRIEVAAPHCNAELLILLMWVVLSLKKHNTYVC